MLRGDSCSTWRCFRFSPSPPSFIANQLPYWGSRFPNKANVDDDYEREKERTKAGHGEIQQPGRAAEKAPVRMAADEDQPLENPIASSVLPSLRHGSGRGNIFFGRLLVFFLGIPGSSLRPRPPRPCPSLLWQPRLPLSLRARCDSASSRAV